MITIANQGASVRLAHPASEDPWQQTVLGELQQRARRARQWLQDAVEQVEHEEPDRRRFGRGAEQRGERRAER
ncbi:MAG: hypothetical protein ACYDHH_20105, partial [Solirubrobacteraceae bacterium]